MTISFKFKTGNCFIGLIKVGSLVLNSGHIIISLDRGFNFPL
jgi:hypothetical protein